MTLGCCSEYLQAMWPRHRWRRCRRWRCMSAMHGAIAQGPDVGAVRFCGDSAPVAAVPAMAVLAMLGAFTQDPMVRAYNFCCVIGEGSGGAGDTPKPYTGPWE